MSWRAIYALLGAAMAVGVVATLLAREPDAAGARPLSLREAVLEPWRDLVGRLGPKVAVVLIFVALFRVPDGMGNAMTMPLLTKGLAFPNATIAVVREGVGLVFGILGALAGGPLVARLGLARSLVLFGVLQSASNLGFSALAAAGRDVPLLTAVVVVENLCAGLTAAAFVAYLMALCDRRYSATQYALFTGIMFLVSTYVGSRTGALITSVGYGTAFAISAAAGLPALLLLPWIPRPPPSRLAPGDAPVD